MTTDDPTIEFAEPATFPAPFRAVRTVFSHGGLASVDPWAVERRSLGALIERTPVFRELDA